MRAAVQSKRVKAFIKLRWGLPNFGERVRGIGAQLFCCGLGFPDGRGSQATTRA
jgi:hypothetical protein